MFWSESVCLILQNSCRPRQNLLQNIIWIFNRFAYIWLLWLLIFLMWGLSSYPACKLSMNSDFPTWYRIDHVITYIPSSMYKKLWIASIIMKHHVFQELICIISIHPCVQFVFILLWSTFSELFELPCWCKSHVTTTCVSRLLSSLP